MMRSSDFAKIIETVGDSILVVDKMGVIRFVNPAACRLFQRDADELKGQIFGFPLTSDGRKELDIIQKGGHIAFAEMVVVDIEWEGEDAYLATLRDITRRKQDEAKLAEARATIEANRLKSKFLTSLSNELKTPLNRILDYTNVILDDFNNEYFVDAPGDIQQIQESAHRLMTMIDQLLSLANIEGGMIDIVLDSVSMEHLVNGLIRNLHSFASSQNDRLHVTIHSECQSIYTDGQKLHTILFHMLHNAIKYSSNSDIKFRILPEHNESGRWIKFEVEDQGTGISPDDLERLFDPFQPKSTQEMSGLGVGLTLSQHFSRLLHGYIEVHSEVGKGSIFALHLPQQIAWVN
ncbi:MAG: PAS domain-containing sensor histidine kinase [Chloroflexi bacterium]|nr:PAS domain-containing sensor histidine kinase [Chloroflexota bacterium]